MGDLLVETKLVPKLHEKSKELEMRVFVDDERLVVEVEEVDVLKNTVDDVFDVDLELDVIDKSHTNNDRRMTGNEILPYFTESNLIILGLGVVLGWVMCICIGCCYWVCRPDRKRRNTHHRTEEQKHSENGGSSDILFRPQPIKSNSVASEPTNIVPHEEIIDNYRPHPDVGNGNSFLIPGESPKQNSIIQELKQGKPLRHNEISIVSTMSTGESSMYDTVLGNMANKNLNKVKSIEPLRHNEISIVSTMSTAESSMYDTVLGNMANKNLNKVESIEPLRHNEISLVSRTSTGESSTYDAVLGNMGNKNVDKLKLIESPNLAVSSPKTEKKSNGTLKTRLNEIIKKEIQEKDVKLTKMTRSGSNLGLVKNPYEATNELEEKQGPVTAESRFNQIIQQKGLKDTVSSIKNSESTMSNLSKITQKDPEVWF